MSQEMPQLSSWSVAAAALILHGEMSINELTDLVIASKLSSLGTKGKTPAKTLGADLRENHGKLFRNPGFGRYDIAAATTALREDSVRRALMHLVDQELSEFRESTYQALQAAGGLLKRDSMGKHRHALIHKRLARLVDIDTSNESSP